MLKDALLVTGAQQIEEIFSLHKYEISFIIYSFGFEITSYLMLNNKIGENSCDIVFIIFWQNNTNTKMCFR